MNDANWTPVEKALPPEGEVVQIMMHDGSVSTLKRVGNLWFIPDGSMYVYFTPLFWKKIP